MVAMAGPPPLYGPYSPNKMGKISEKGEQYSHDYMFLPLAPSAEGIETPIAVTGPPLMTHGPHPRVGHPYMFPPHPGKFKGKRLDIINFLHIALGFNDIIVILFFFYI
ncbi:APOBEC1 complementation factor [Trichonephila clavipes]|nr:APOBEC1 complementation factor [Trichonephila clavipes]